MIRSRYQLGERSVFGHEIKTNRFCSYVPWQRLQNSPRQSTGVLSDYLYRRNERGNTHGVSRHHIRETKFHRALIFCPNTSVAAVERVEREWNAMSAQWEQHARGSLTSQWGKTRARTCNSRWELSSALPYTRTWAHLNNSFNNSSFTVIKAKIFPIEI